MGRIPFFYTKWLIPKNILSKHYYEFLIFYTFTTLEELLGILYI